MSLSIHSNLGHSNLGDAGWLQSHGYEYFFFFLFVENKGNLIAAGLLYEKNAYPIIGRAKTAIVTLTPTSRTLSVHPGNVGFSLTNTKYGLWCLGLAADGNSLNYIFDVQNGYSFDVLAAITDYKIGEPQTFPYKDGILICSGELIGGQAGIGIVVDTLWTLHYYDI
ncbi:MAG: hypothetical protein LBH03_02145, partial [Holophagales bacterium]|nr:hypothetical protein [Holophagales bacterium]